MAVVTEEYILKRLALCPMTVEELVEDLRSSSSTIADLLGLLLRRGVIGQRRSSRADGEFLYFLPNHRQHSESTRETLDEIRTARNYGALYSGGFDS